MTAPDGGSASLGLLAAASGDSPAPLDARPESSHPGGSPAASLRRLPPGPGVSRVPELAGLRVCGTAGPRPPGFVGLRYPGPWSSRASSYQGPCAPETVGFSACDSVLPRACNSGVLWVHGTTILGPPDASGSHARGIAGPRARGLQGGRSPGLPGSRSCGSPGPWPCGTAGFRTRRTSVPRFRDLAVLRCRKPQGPRDSGR
jgi:hypothetical protein